MSKPTIASDSDFKEITKKEFQHLSEMHWSPKEVIDQSLNWLAAFGQLHILDIGSGVGKFCLLGAATHHQHQFTGIEKRKDFHFEAIRLKEHLQLPNVTFLCDDIINLPFEKFHAFYIFNPFYEQLVNHGSTLRNTKFDKENFIKYESYLKGRLINSPAGNIVITYEYNLMEKVSGFELLKEAYEGALQMWRKR